MTLTTVPLEAIKPGTNVRHDVGEITELAKSIEAVGLLNPLTVRPAGNGRDLELVAGYRRFAALTLLKAKNVDVKVIDEDVERTAAQLVENLQRSDLNPAEEAEGLAELVKIAGSQANAARLIGRSKGWVSKRLAITKLPDEILEHVALGTIKVEDAYELSKITDLEEDLTELATLAAEGSEPYLGFAHHAQEARRRDDRQRRLEAANAELKAAGFKLLGDMHKAYRINPEPRPFGGGISFAKVADGFELHKSEPCHRAYAAIIAGKDEIDVGHWCAEPERHRINGDSELKADDALNRERGEAKLQREREARRAIKAHRRQWLTDYVTRRISKPALTDLLADAVLADWIDVGADRTLLKRAFDAAGLGDPDEVWTLTKPADRHRAALIITLVTLESRYDGSSNGYAYQGARAREAVLFADFAEAAGFEPLEIDLDDEPDQEATS